MNRQSAYEMFLLEYKKNIKKAGLNTTYHRNLVLKALFFASGYSNAEEIKKKIKDEYKVHIKLDLVSKILLFLEKIEMVIVASIPQQEKKYRLLCHAKEGRFICKNSARVEEFEDAELFALVHQAAKRYGFEVDKNRTFILV